MSACNVTHDIVICIPSYQRAHICNDQTLRMLHEANVPRDIVYVFVANAMEYTHYKNVLDAQRYNTIHIGRKGLVQQREFITNMFAYGKRIIFLDDDVQAIDMSMSSMFNALALVQFFERAFDICASQGTYIWGVYPVFNPFFRRPRPDIYRGLTYIVGACYGIINTPSDNRVRLSITRQNGQKEDVERSIKYFLRDGAVLRFDRVGFVTRYYGRTGGLGRFEDRLKPMEDAVRKLKTRYPDLGEVRIKKSGMTEFRLKTIRR